MKATVAVIFYAFFATCFIASCSGQEWSAVLQKVEEIKGLIMAAIAKIQTMAEKDNPEVAQELKPLIEGVVEKASAILEKTMDSLNKKTLTEDKAKALFIKLEEEVARIQPEGQKLLNKLSEKTANKIRATFITTLGDANRLATAGFKLLPANDDNSNQKK